VARQDLNIEALDAGLRDRGVVLRGRDQEGRKWSARVYGPGSAGYSEENPDEIFLGLTVPLTLRIWPTR
jgi:hypothetical protein